VRGVCSSFCVHVLLSFCVFGCGSWGLGVDKGYDFKGNFGVGGGKDRVLWFVTVGWSGNRLVLF